MPRTSTRHEVKSLTGHAARGVTAGILGALLLATPATYVFADQAPQVRSVSSTQMSSKEEVVYVNTLNDPAARIQNFNENWKFNLGDAKGAEAPEFDDSSWEHVDLPHDYSIDQEYTKQGEAESGYKLGGIGWYRKSFMVGPEMAGKSIRVDFDGVYMDSTVWINGHKLGGHPNGYTQFSFDLTKYIKPGEENTLVVKVNHETPSSRWYSGSGIGRDVNLVVTDPVHVAKDGVVVTAPELSASNKTNVKTSFKTTVHNDGKDPAAFTVVNTVFPRGGKPGEEIASASKEVNVGAGKSVTVDTSADTTSAPKLWSTTSPNLYTVRTEIQQGDKVVDTYDVDFGYRFFDFDANNGFTLNGQKMKIKGVCMHHDQGALGSVSSRDALERQVKLLKDMGCNAIRTSHNAPARELVEICNEQGMMLDVEFFDGLAWPKNGNGKDYARFFNQKMGESELVGADMDKTWAQFDLEQGIARDINSPAVIMWSLGNEMSESAYGYNQGEARVILQNLIKWAQAADPTRVVTTGDNKMKGDANNKELNSDLLGENKSGVVGLNYASSEQYKAVHAAKPNWCLIGSETASATNSRGVYTTKQSNTLDGNKLLTSYDKSKVGWGALASEAWYDVITNDFMSGEFVWTGFDYLGEPTPANGTNAGAQGSWPSPKSSYFGIIDTAGLPKDSYYLYQSLWNEQKHTLHILPTWDEDTVIKDGGKNVEVVVYTDAPEVELLFTPAKGGGTTSLGRKKLTEVSTEGGYKYRVYKGENGKENPNHSDLYLTWNVPYADGTITAKAYNDKGEEISTKDFDGRKSVTTTGPAKKLRATVNRDGMSGNGSDLAYVTVDVIDEQGNIVPDAKNKVSFKVTGAGELAGIDNGVQADHQSYRDDSRAAQAGQLVGIVRAGESSGEATVTVSADGLQAATVKIPVAADPSQPGSGKQVDSFFYAKNYYVKTGSKLQLPTKIEVRYADGSSSERPVTWSAVSNEQLSTPGSFRVSGTAEGLPISANVTVLTEVAALLNYTTTTQVGVAPALPQGRPAVLADGTVLNASFPVAWKTPLESAYGTAGNVMVEGTANVFGKDVTVTAVVRVQEGEVVLGDSATKDAKLSQSISSDMASDTLEAIKDGKTEISANTGGDRNDTCWSNYKASQSGQNKASITFRYDTQRAFGRINVFFARDNNSGRYPDAGATTFEVSETGTDGSWRTLDVAEEIAQQETSANVKKYSYSFAPTTATFVRMTVTNAGSQEARTAKPCTMVTEVELIEATRSYPVGATAELSSLTVNGQKVSNSALAAGEYSTRALTAEIEAAPADNAAMTVLPAHENKIKILLESEDHSKSSVFTINLAADHDSSDALAADDDSRDYPVEKMTKNTAGSEHTPESGGEGPIGLAFDKNTDTKFHSDWAGGEQSDMWVQMELPEPATIEALRYLPRQDTSDNGTVTKYRIQYSDNGKDWQDAATGTWERNKQWKVAQFAKPVTAKFFRLEAPETYADNNKVLMSAAEIRLRQPREAIDIADGSKVKIEVPAKVTVNRLSEKYPVDATVLDEKVTAGDKTLVYGVDYLMTFANNTKPGAATVTFEGIGNYSGTVERAFQIELKSELAGVAVKPESVKTTYKAGEKLDFTGLVLNATMTDDSTFEVAYNAETKSDFSFDPAEGAELKGNQTLDVTVSYKGKRATFTVSVAAPEAPNPPAGPDGNGNGDGGNAGVGSQATPQGGEQSKPAKPSKPGRPHGSLAQTGDNAILMIGGIAVAAVALVVVGVLVRKRR